MNRETWRKTAFVLVAAFAVIFFYLILQGGMCERYERKMERQRLMREYIDSQRTKQQREILNR